MNDIEKSATRWDKLMRLVGHLQNDSQTTITFYQDDATGTAHIRLGDKSGSFYSEHGGFGTIIDAIPDVCKHCAGNLPCQTCTDLFGA